MKDDEEIVDPALRFDRSQFEPYFGARQAGTLMDRALPSVYYQKERAWQFANALKALRDRRIHELTALDPVPGIKDEDHFLVEEEEGWVL
jgi:hypothetical protein